MFPALFLGTGIVSNNISPDAPADPSGTLSHIQINDELRIKCLIFSFLILFAPLALEQSVRTGGWSRLGQLQFAQQVLALR